MASVRVPFDWTDVQRAAVAGVARVIEDRRHGRRAAYGNDNSSFQPDIDGCVGELAVARYRGLEHEWIAVAHRWLPATDVGLLQVRATAYASGRLLLHHEDADQDPFVLVTYTLRAATPVVTLCGWLQAGEGKQQRWWRELNSDKRPCFAVPQSELRPMSSLPWTTSEPEEALPDWLR